MKKIIRLLVVELILFGALLHCSQSSGVSASSDAASTESGSLTCVEPNEFDQSCQFDSDCTGVPDCTLQRQGCTSCIGAEIIKKALATFQTQLSIAVPTPIGCPCMGLFPRCERGMCISSTTPDAGSD